ncbi:maleylpyruvate isomerase family mycothiol-dependent enzyme [Streptomyces sp. MS06]|uniref:maleylpyruvate isomerase family mycothiol-dependent enzyme n=1 Tax=Streptomyces sp. MS06 TaxID=3385974 RepID=UPI0039A3B92B
MTLSISEPSGHHPVRSQVDHRAAVAAETARFVAAVEGADPATPVPGCPGWTLNDLIRHTGSVQRWFSVLLRKRIQQPPSTRDVELHLPDREDEYPGWLAASAEVAADAFSTTGPDLPMWAWGADQHARFWARRMFFETLLHRADAETALGRRPVVDRPAAVDGIDEFLVNLPFAAFFAPKVADLRASDRTVLFAASDGDERWLVRLRPDGFGLDPAHAAADDGDAVVRGAAADLLLLVYGRVSLDGGLVSVEGDGELLEHWFANSAF